jgi:DNA-binding protein H-NS
MNPDTQPSMSEQELSVQPKKKRGRPSKIDKFRQTLTDKTWTNGQAPIAIVERLKELDRQGDSNTYALYLEWKV